MSDLIGIISLAIFVLMAISGIAYIAAERLISYHVQDGKLQSKENKTSVIYGRPFYRVRDDYVFSARHKSLGDRTFTRYVYLYRFSLTAVFSCFATLAIGAIALHYIQTLK